MDRFPDMLTLQYVWSMMGSHTHIKWKCKLLPQHVGMGCIRVHIILVDAPESKPGSGFHRKSKLLHVGLFLPQVKLSSQFLITIIFSAFVVYYYHIINLLLSRFSIKQFAFNHECIRIKLLVSNYKRATRHKSNSASEYLWEIHVHVS